MKTQAELKAHYRDVIIPMVAKYNYDHETDVKPWECVKLDGRIMICHPKFEYKPDIYTFAITILEGKPVFVGDTLYYKDTSFVVVYCDQKQSFDNCTWTPPKKRTFVLNGVELPCPIQNSIGCRLDFLGVDYHFETVQDRNKVANAISNILNQSETRSKQNVL